MTSDTRPTTGLIQRLWQALRADGKDPDNLRPEDLAAVDQFHIRGKQASVELAELLAGQLSVDHPRILDLGAGLGGASRYLAGRFEGAIIGLELNADYVSAAQALSQRLGLAAQTEFKLGDATAIPFADQCFDAVWLQHLSMAIENKERLFSEIFRVLKPGGLLALQEITAGPGGQVLFPVPWAQTAEHSHLSSTAELLAQLQHPGLTLLDHQDLTLEALQWFERQAQQRSQPRRRSLGLALLLGESFALMMSNQRRNLSEQRIGLVQLLAQRPL